MKKENLENSHEKIIMQYDFLKHLREKIFDYISKPNMTVKKLSDMSDIPYASLNNLLYGNTRDCKLSTVIYLSRAMGIGIDELIGHRTLDDDTIKNIQIMRELPPNSAHLINWYIEYQKVMYEKIPKDNTVISVMHPVCNGAGNMKMKDLYEKLDITDLDKEVRGKVFFGIKIPCDHYMPFYSHFDTILIANDRNANFNEDVIVFNDGCLFFASRKIVDGQAKLYSIRDGRFRRNEKDVDMVVGYVAKVIHNDTI